MPIASFALIDFNILPPQRIQARMSPLKSEPNIYVFEILIFLSFPILIILYGCKIITAYIYKLIIPKIKFYKTFFE